jgi:hypothetical protein
VSRGKIWAFLEKSLSDFRNHRNEFGLFATIKSAIGYNETLLYSLGSKMWIALSSFVSVMLITSFFTSETQGYYYLFSSLIVFHGLFDIGFSLVLIQFVSHEWANLSLSPEGVIKGSPESLTKLQNLVRLGDKWYLFVATAFLLIIGIGGIWFITSESSSEQNDTIMVPWILLVTTTSCSILLSPKKALLEGSNNIKECQKIILFSSMVSSLVGWVSIVIGLELYTMFAISLVNALLTLLLIYKPILPFYQINKSYNVSGYSFNKEFWNQQWRVGISLLLGYFLFQAFTPLAFKLVNSSEAGRIGATMQLYNMVNLVGITWVNIIGPRLGILSAQKNYGEIERLVNRTLLRSILMSGLTFVFIYFVLLIMQSLNLKQLSRFTDFYTLGFILLTGVVIQVSNVMATAIRFQKKEPFMIPTLVSSFLMIAISIFTVKFLGPMGMGFTFFFVISLILVPWVYFIYRSEMKKLQIESKL